MDERTKQPRNPQRGETPEGAPGQGVTRRTVRLHYQCPLCGDVHVSEQHTSIRAENGAENLEELRARMEDTLSRGRTEETALQRAAREFHRARGDHELMLFLAVQIHAPPGARMVRYEITDETNHT